MKVNGPSANSVLTRIRPRTKAKNIVPKKESSIQKLS